MFTKAMHDAVRSGELSKLGIQVVRVRNEDVFHQPTATWDFLVGAVVRVIGERTGCCESDVLRELHDPSP